MGNPILNKHKAAVADLRGWAAKMVQAWGKKHPNTDPSARDRLIRDAVMIYSRCAKVPFKDFRNRKQFIFDLLEIAGVYTKKKPPGAGHAAKGRRDGERAVELVIQACCRVENIFPQAKRS